MCKRIQYMCKNWTKKLVEIVVRMGDKGWGRLREGVNLIKIHCKNICKCHNETTIYTLVKKTNKKPKIRERFQLWEGFNALICYWDVGGPCLRIKQRLLGGKWPLGDTQQRNRALHTTAQGTEFWLNLDTDSLAQLPVGTQTYNTLILSLWDFKQKNQWRFTVPEPLT
jgi:hypothetical protein